MGWVYIIHSKGVRRRIASHRETTWTPYDEPVRTDDGRVIAGEKHGPGALIMGVVNSKGIRWEVACIFRNVTRAFERRVKNSKHIARYCPICNPNANRFHDLEWCKRKIEWVFAKMGVICPPIKTARER